MMVLTGFSVVGAAPQHTRVYYEHDLQSQSDDEIALLTNTGGEFVAGKGWRSRTIDGKLTVDLKNDLPFEGTVEVKLTNLRMDQLASDWVPLSIWSDPGGHFWEVHQTSTNYAFFKTAPKYYNDGTLYWTLWHSPFAYSDTPKNQWDRYANKWYPFAKKAYSASGDYTFRIIWTAQKVYFMIDNEEYEFSQLPPYGPVEAFSRILIGDDETTAYHAFSGVIFSDLKILLPESPLEFTDVSRRTGLFQDGWHGAQSVTVTDFDADGLEDVFISACNLEAPQDNLLYRQQEDGSFIEEAAARGLMVSGCSRGAVFADFNRDGHMDFFEAVTGGSNRLYINRGDGSFSDETAAHGISTGSNDTQQVLAVDIDGDSDVDIGVLNNTNPHEIYINQGDGRFTLSTEKLTAASGSANAPITGAVSGDIDGNGSTDLFITRRNASCLLMMNDGNGFYSDRSSSRGVVVNAKVNNPLLIDYDRDGDLDLFISQAYDDLDPEPPLLAFRNNGSGIFTEFTSSLGIRADAFGIYAGDFDNDTYPDLYVLKNNRKNALTAAEIHRNTGSGLYTKIRGSGAEVVYADGRAAVVADLDQDGRLDIIAAGYGGTIGDGEQYGRHYFLRNTTSTDNHYVLLEILDNQKKRGGLGAKVWIFAAGFLNDMQRLLGFREIQTAQGYRSHGSFLQHFGLGSNSSCDIRIAYSDGTIETYSGVQSDQVFSVGLVPPVVVPKRVERLSAESFVGTVGEFLADTLAVRILDDRDRPVQGHTVEFTIQAGGGKLNAESLEQVTIQTDADGIARARWRLGTVADRINRVRAIARHEGNELEGSPVEFSATANMAPDSVISSRTAQPLTGARGAVLPDSIKILVHDGLQNPRSGVQVRFTVLSGGGSIGGQSSVLRITRTDGTAAIAWTLGQDGGDQAHSLRAEIVGSAEPFVVFYATATYGLPAALIQVSGDGQSGRVGQTLAAPFVVKLVDDRNTAVPGFTILFRVLSEQGTLQGKRQLSVATDANGQAFVFLTLGGEVGEGIYRIEASYSGLQQTVIFSSSALPGKAARLVKIEGDQQSTTLNRDFPIPLAVAVTDSFNNPIAGHPIAFTATADLLVGGKTVKSVNTDAQGIAAVQATAGNTPGQFVVTASGEQDGQPLDSSPAAFALNVSSPPAYLYKVSGDSTIGIVNQIAVQPLQVRITDLTGKASSNHPVTFVVRQGGGSFNGQLETVVFTDAQGRAIATPRLGGTSGLNNNVFEARAFGDKGQQLSGSPAVFTLSAKLNTASRILMVDGNNQTAQAGQVLPRPFRIKVVDAAHNPIPGHDVLFSVESGNGKLGNNLTDRVTIATNLEGIASVAARLGAEVGIDNHLFSARATDGISPLLESPLFFTASAPYGPIDPVVSELSVTTPVAADGVFESIVTVRLRDSQGNPVPHETISLIVNGEKTFVQQPAFPTDSLGQAVGAVRSTRAGIKTVSARAVRSGINIQKTVEIEFIAGPPAEIQLVSGDRQIGTLNTRLEEPLVCRIADAQDNPIENIPVTFTPRPGCGYIMNEQPVPTDASGEVSVYWFLGSSADSQFVDIHIDELPRQKTAIAFVNPPAGPQVVKIKGDGQFARPGFRFADSLMVQVISSSGAPVSNINVQFSVIRGDATVQPNRCSTDLGGFARASLTAGTQLGPVSVQARLENYSNVEFVCAIANAAPDSMFHLVGDGSKGVVGNTLSPLAVMVVDAEITPIATVPVTLISETAGGKVVSVNPIKSNGNGQAIFSVQLGERAQTYRFRAVNPDLKGSPVHFNLIALPDKPEVIEVIAGDGQSGLGGDVLSDTIQVRISDQFGNGIPE
ncbi:Ig-like domain-containing protein, partial [candidate division KSB1 bacterium]|nr:Ig-like domain-containing protein [candidate division KSB1 bacterium]